MHENLIHNEILNGTDTATLHSHTPWELATKQAFGQHLASGTDPGFKETDLDMLGF